MSMKKCFSAAEIPVEDEKHQRRRDQFNPETEQKDANKEEEVKRDEAEQPKEDDNDEDEDAEEEDSEDGRSSSTSGEKSEFMDIDLEEIRKAVQCPICLGIIRKTRTVMGCLHRFCRICIDKSMRLGNNECPACRKHCASRRSLRDDSTFDALIAALFPNIDSYEEGEMALHEDEMARSNKQIQASIAEISQRQSEALKRRSSCAATGSKRKRNCRNMEQQNSLEAHDNDNDDNNHGGGGVKDSSSDERSAEIRERKRIKQSRQQHPSTSGANGNCRGISPEILAWGSGGTRSNTRHGNNTTGGSKSSSKSLRNGHVKRLVEYLGNSGDGNRVEVDIRLKLVSLDTNCIPDLPQPYLYCRSTLLVKQLREFVALKMKLKTEEIELLVTREASKDEMLSLEDNETLSNLKVDLISSHLIIAYREKQLGA